VLVVVNVAHYNVNFASFRALTLLVGWQARHPVTCKRLCQWNLPCFYAVDWM